MKRATFDLGLIRHRDDKELHEDLVFPTLFDPAVWIIQDGKTSSPILSDAYF